MDNGTWINTITATWHELAEHAASYLPRVLAGALVLIAGWLLARLLRALAVRLVSGLDRLWRRLIQRRGLEGLQPAHPPAKVVGELVFWVVVLFFLAATAQILGLGIFVTWLSEVVSYLPVLLSALLIVLAGVVAGALARDLVASTAPSIGVAHGELFGRVTQAAILVTAIVVGVDQAGVDIGFLSLVVGIALAALLGSLGLAFGLGAHTHVSNLLAAQGLRKVYEIGDTVRIGEYEGTVSELGATTVTLEAHEARIIVPAHQFAREVSVIRSSEDQT